MAGGQVLITGGSSGIGLETARGLARLGAQVSIVGRNRDKTLRAADDLRASTGGPVGLFIADLSSMAEVRRVAAEIEARLGRLDVLVNNAGAINPRRELTLDGYERTFATNHLAPFLLTNLLLPALARSPAARVVNVSGEIHRGQRLDFDDLMAAKRYVSFMAYGRSKLANLLFTRELARRLAGRPVTVNALHPGVVRSEFMAKPGFLGALKKLTGVLMISPEEGAKTSIFLASSPAVAQVTGGYFVKERQVRPSRAARDDAAAARLWEVSAKLVGLAGEEPPAGERPRLRSG